MGVTQANGISRIEADASPRLQEFFALTKPRVVSLIVFTAVIGMFLATPEMVAFQPLVFGAIGIALVAGAAATTNCLLEHRLAAVARRSVTSADQSAHETPVSRYIRNSPRPYMKSSGLGGRFEYCLINARS